MLTAVFDIGKTNKKFLLFDEELSVLSEESVTLDQTTDDDGDPCEDISVLATWVRETFESALDGGMAGRPISRVNFSAYGASLVHLGPGGKPIAPLYNYLKPYPDDALRLFNERYGDTNSFVAETASPVLGMLNSGLQLYWIKKVKPHIFSQIDMSLHLPQYCSYLLAGHAHDEGTSLGCHTAMWDFTRNRYHAWMESEDLVQLLPPISASTSSFPALGLETAVGRPAVGAGVHDSSAALYPYLRAFSDPFVLVSTGTWSVAMNPFSRQSLSASDIRSGALCYLTPDMRAVRSSRLFIGFEHDHQVRRIAEKFSVDADFFREVTLDESVLTEGRQIANGFVPSGNLASGARHADRWDPAGYDSAAAAYHALVDGLVERLVKAIELVKGETTVSKIFVDGGFSRNILFLRLLSRALAPTPVESAELAQASSIGAALLVNGHIEAEHVRRLIETNRVSQA